MPPMLVAVAGVATSLAGGAISAAGAAEQGANAQAEGQYEQAQYEQESDTSVARAQRKAEEQRRRGTLVQSQLVARGAGAGLNPAVGSTSVLSQQIAGRSEYSELNDLAAGQDMAAGYENMGEAAAYRGRLAQSMVPIEEAGSFAGAASSAFGTIGRFVNSGGFSNPGGFG